MIIYILIGVILGICLIIPGVSGGVFAVTLGVYDKILYSVNNFFKQKKKSFLFLFPILLGMLLGIILFGNILKYAFSNYKMECCFTFIGLILGGVPVLFKNTRKHGKINYYVLVFSFILSFLIFVFGKESLNISNAYNEGFLYNIKLFFTGIVFMSGKVIPGISSSFMTMVMGMYDFVLNVLSNPFRALTTNFFEVLPFILGMIVGLFVLAKMMGFLLKKYYSLTYSVIIGFVIGSVPAIYPGFQFNNRGLISLILFVSAFLLSYTFSNLNKEKNKNIAKK